MTTKLYSEALLEAKKLKEIAEEDAKKSILESITPYIRKTISEQIKENSENFFTEQEEVPAPADTDASLDDMSMSDVTGLGNQATSSLGDTEAPPLAAKGGDVISATMPDSEGKIVVDFEDLFSELGEDEVMPGAPSSDMDSLNLGNSTSDQPTADVAPVQEPPAAPGQQQPPTPPADESGNLEATEEDLPDMNLAAESLSYDSFKKALHEVSEKIDYLYFNESSSGIAKEAMNSRLFQLLESVDLMKAQGKITSKQAKLGENKLDFLFLKLKEAKLDNSYNKKDPTMTTLKEYAAKLLFEGDDVNQPTTASGKHAADVSGVDPNVGTKEDLKGKAEDGNPGAVNEEMLPGAAGTVDSDPLPGTNPNHKKEEQWASGEASLSEEDQDKMLEEAINSLCEEMGKDDEECDDDDDDDDKEMNEAAAGFGDTDEKPAVEFEVDEKALAEEVSRLRKESIRKKMKNLKEEAKAKKPTEEGWEEGEPEGGLDPSHDNLKESLNEVDDMDSDVEMDDMDGDMDDMDDMDDMESDMDDDMGDMESDMDDDMGDMDMDGDLVLNVDLPDDVKDALADVDVSSMDDIRVELADVNLGSNKEGVVDSEYSMDDDMDDDMDDEMDDDMAPPPPAPPGMGPMGESYKKKAAILESRLARAKKESDILKTNLKEANLFLAKNVYFTKFLQRGDLSKKNLTKIVEYLDSAKTVSEAKTIYGKIKAKLAEVSSQSSDKLVGSPSKVTKPGSALNEGVSSRKTTAESHDPVVSSVERWQELANIKVKK